MIDIIGPKQFKTIPWKNGLGETTELAINELANLDNFIWRMSIASVVEDGVFSDFSGYYRNLVLIEGEGISLEHDAKSVDDLVNLLDVASFDGGCKTQGLLSHGPIKDFNIITDKSKVTTQVDCYVDENQVTVTLSKSALCFVYSLSDVTSITASQQDDAELPAGSLAKITQTKLEFGSQDFWVRVKGKNMIIIQLEIEDLEK